MLPDSEWQVRTAYMQQKMFPMLKKTSAHVFWDMEVYIYSKYTIKCTYIENAWVLKTAFQDLEQVYKYFKRNSILDPLMWNILKFLPCPEHMYIYIDCLNIWSTHRSRRLPTHCQNMTVYCTFIHPYSLFCTWRPGMSQLRAGKVRKYSQIWENRNIETKQLQTNKSTLHALCPKSSLYKRRLTGKRMKLSVSQSHKWYHLLLYVTYFQKFILLRTTPYIFNTDKPKRDTLLHTFSRQYLGIVIGF